MATEQHAHHLEIERQLIFYATATIQPTLERDSALFAGKKAVTGCDVVAQRHIGEPQLVEQDRGRIGVEGDAIATHIQQPVFCWRRLRAWPVEQKRRGRLIELNVLTGLKLGMLSHIEHRHCLTIAGEPCQGICKLRQLSCKTLLGIVPEDEPALFEFLV
ncbi:hypothetical protein D3C79_850540 [compost metagenome]